MECGRYGFTTKQGNDAQSGGNGCSNLKHYADTVKFSNSYP
jgi:hypothetical protein